MSASHDDSQDDNDRDPPLPELNMDHLFGSSGNISSLRCYLNRRRLEPLPEEEDSPVKDNEVGWW